jgi:hypothetical protein
MVILLKIRNEVVEVGTPKNKLSIKLILEHEKGMKET